MKSGVTDTDNDASQGRVISLILIVIMINCMSEEKYKGGGLKETKLLRALNKDEELQAVRNKLHEREAVSLHNIILCRCLLKMRLLTCN